MAQNLDKAWNRHTDLLLVLSERYQKERDDEALVSREELERYRDGCDQAVSGVQIMMSRVGMPIVDAADQGKWADLDVGVHQKTLDYLGAKMRVGFWCGSADAVGDATVRSSALDFIQSASDAAEHKIKLMMDMYNSLVGEYNGVLRAYNADEAYLKAAEDVIASGQKLIDMDNKLLSLPS